MSKKLSLEHYSMLSGESGISDEVIAAVGYRTVTDPKELAALGFKDFQRVVPGLLIPSHHVNGSIAEFSQFRADNPRKKEGKLVKYDTVLGAAPVLDCPPVPLMVRTLRESKDAVWISEGSKKAAAAVSHGIPCLSVSGVYSWRAKNEHGVKVIIPDLDEIDWQGRKVYLAFDGDVVKNPLVHSALMRLSGVLHSRGANVEYTVLPADCGGLDEALVAGQTRESLLAMSSDVLPAAPSASHPMTEQGLALRTFDLNRGKIIFDAYQNVWYVWEKNQWVMDKSGVYAQTLVRDAHTTFMEELGAIREVEVFKKMKKIVENLGGFRSISNATSLLKLDVKEDRTPFDADPNLLYVKNGVLNLKTLEFSQMSPEFRLLTQANANWDDKAECPKWLEFMEDRFADPETRRFVQRMCGMLVTGESPEKAFFIVQGEADTGKSLFVEFLHWVLGGYANKVGKETLMADKFGKLQSEKAVELVGKRFVYVDESAIGDKLDEAFIKNLTGGDSTLKYRRLYHQEAECESQFTVMLATNFRPRATGSDAAMWRRVNLIEFGKPIPRDKQQIDFKQRLKEEADGVLRWMVMGYRDWIENGLNVPAQIRDWTEAYQEDNDPLGKFLKESYEMGDGVEGDTTPGHLFLHFQAWCNANDVTIKAFNAASSLSRSIRKRYPFTSDGPTGGGQGRKLYHMKAKMPFRATDGIEASLEG